jgi:hypothetical protein
MGEDLAAAHPDPVPRRILHSAGLRESSLPSCAGAVCLHGHRGRGRAGGLSGRRPDPGRLVALTETRPSRLYDALLPPRMGKRHRLHPGRNQLRPDLRRPQPADITGQESTAEKPPVRYRHLAEISISGRRSP